jgi:carbon monoxide dehydrogenase subunit G
LRENGDAEIVIVTDMQLMAQGRWTKSADPSQGIALKITGGTVAGNAKGSGKLFLREDGKTIDKLNFEVKSNARSKVTVDFVADTN